MRLTSFVLLISAIAIGCWSCQSRKTGEVTMTPEPKDKGGTVIMVEGTVPNPAPSPSPPPAAEISLTQPVTVTTTSMTSVPAPAPVIAAQPPTAVEAGTMSITEKVGVLECDNFASQYASCINQYVPASEREGRIQALEQSIRKWQAMAVAAPQAKNDAINECLRARDLTRQETRQYGCAWDTVR